jgi:predicted O-methyltransferase YrrM
MTSNTLNESLVSAKLTELNGLAAAQKNEQDNYQLRTAERFMAVSPEQGQFLHFLAGLSKRRNIVEFGCSYGISGSYLASAAIDNGGRVITTELNYLRFIVAIQASTSAGAKLRNKVSGSVFFPPFTSLAKNASISFSFSFGYKV